MIRLACILVIVSAATALGQPATQPTDDHPVPVADALRKAAGDYENMVYILRVKEDQIIRLQAEATQAENGLAEALNRLRNTPEVLTPTTELKTGGIYAAPWKQPGNWRVAVPGVTVYGGWVWSETGGSVFSVAGGGTGFRNFGTRFDRDGFTDTPDGNVAGMGPCVTTAAAKTEVYGATLGHVNDFVKALPGSSELKVIDCTDADKDIRLAAVYLGGCKGAEIRGCTFLGSRKENTVRMSPEGDAVSEDVVIEGNTLGNSGKHAIDARHVRGVVIRHNEIFGTDPRASIIRIGDSSSLPGATGVVFEDNGIHRGLVLAMKNSVGAAKRDQFFDADTTLALWSLDKDSKFDVNGGNVGWVSGAVPAGAKRLPPGNVWQPMP